MKYVNTIVKQVDDTMEPYVVLVLQLIMALQTNIT